MVEPYNYVRFRWWDGVDFKKTSEDIGKSFSVEMHIKTPPNETDIAIFKDDRDELKVSADTLSALLSRFRVVLYQVKAAPFTAKDLELRKILLEIYPRNRPTPFPWSFTEESKYEIAK